MQHEHEHGYGCDWIVVVKMIISMKQYSATCNVDRMTQLFVDCYRVCATRGTRKKKKETKIVTDASSRGKKRTSKNWLRSRLCEDCEHILHGHKQHRRNSNHSFNACSLFVTLWTTLKKCFDPEKREKKKKKTKKRKERKNGARTIKWEGHRSGALLLLY